MEFTQRVFLILLSAFLTYGLSLQMMNGGGDSVSFERINEIQKWTGKHIYLNSYETTIISDLLLPHEIKTSLNTIYGLKKEKETIVRALFGVKNKIFKNTSNARGILLHGQPGTGKTMIAQGIAKSAGLPLICFNISNIESKLLGESNKLISALFSVANKMSPCVIFIDEIDCVCSSRNSFDQSHVNSMKSVMLTHMDGMSTNNTDTIFIGATNRLDVIDTAFRRRIPVVVEIPMPSIHDIHRLISSMIHADSELIHEISWLCVGMSCSDIKQLVQIVSTSYGSSDDLKQCFVNQMHYIDV